eukprot:CAMPEP_0184657556 /NCGR_PEP_ID=MMETSP0308-20130426/20301_1 /TAXON_ID=38269 /ORGANISM="Gloeochaete witrockiana, Strain SAG 46.84" /LENGTH=874 /DNA_ID=CAMNT_0027095527 /DNA_START=32 /DNA_END=2656 /DNA_ORIENTATION=+
MVASAQPYQLGMQTFGSTQQSFNNSGYQQFRQFEPTSQPDDDLYEGFNTFGAVDQVGGAFGGPGVDPDAVAQNEEAFGTFGYTDGSDVPFGSGQNLFAPAPVPTAGPVPGMQSGMQTASGTRRAPISSLANRRPPPNATVTAEAPLRPMTSVKAAGYTSQGNRAGTAAGRGVFDPLGARGPAPALQKRSENSPEEMARELEKKVNALIEESSMANKMGDLSLALEKAKQAAKQERALCKQRESNGLADQINIDLTYSVCFNLAVQYHANDMYTEALNAYQAIVKNKQYAQSGRLRVNMGNIYFEQKKFPNAIKMYRMALDQIPNTGKEIRFKIQRNIGNAFVRIGQFADAIQSYEAIMDGNADFITGFNLLLCYFALGDKEKMKKGFLKLLSIKQALPEDEDGPPEKGADSVLIEDGLKEELKERQREAVTVITNASKLVAPVVEKDVYIGFDWVIENLKTSNLGQIASEMEIMKAVTFLKKRQFDKAVESFKAFEKKDPRLLARASTNLSFLYFLEGDIKQAEKYANVAVQQDRFNARALVNKGNISFQKGDLQAAKELYTEAVGVDSDCIEGLYNLGLINKKLELYDEALQNFEKIQVIMPSNSEVVYQMANLYDVQNQHLKAIKWFKILTSLVPMDAGVQARLGNLYSREDDESQAYHYHLESYRFFPVNMDVISWLGAYFVKSEVYEQAMKYFERAAQIQPTEVKWQLMVASCHRRIGSYQQALNIYEQIHEKYPDNIECLRYLVHICTDLGKRDQVHEYVQLLRKAERAQEGKSSAPSSTSASASASAPNPPPTAAPSRPTSDMPGPPPTAAPRPLVEERGQSLEIEDDQQEAMPESPVETKPSRTIKLKKSDEDDWENAELDDNLLPM